MSNLEALTLKDAPLPKIKVHATVICSILHNFMRRTPRDSRVIGTLLGEVKDGVVTVSECFAVPFTEKLDELYVAIDQKYHKHMYAFHRRNNKKEVIVGWYTTTTANGQCIIDNSSLVHDFYSSECANPVHLVVDASLLADTMNTRGFVSKPMTLGDEILAHAFQEVKVDVVMTDSEATCMYHMINNQSTATATAAAAKWEDSSILSTLPTAAQSVEESILGLQRLLDNVQSYVDGVVEGTIPATREIGMAITEALNSTAAQRVQGAQMGALHTRMQDMLMVSYITTLTQTQALISEKLNEIL